VPFELDNIQPDDEQKLREGKRSDPHHPIAQKLNSKGRRRFWATKGPKFIQGEADQSSAQPTDGMRKQRVQLQKPGQELEDDREVGDIGNATHNKETGCVLREALSDPIFWFYFHYYSTRRVACHATVFISDV
jgi:hypothetical protein